MLNLQLIKKAAKLFLPANQIDKLFSVMLRSLVCIGVLLIAVLQASAQRNAVQLVNLQTEYATTPLGLDIERPAFSWQMQSAVKGVYQQAYRVLVLDAKGAKVWDSQKVMSENSLGIGYGGAKLMPRTKYRWQLEVWDQRGSRHRASSWFETGLLDTTAAQSAWDDAQWIGGSDHDMVLQANYLPVFTVAFSIALPADGISTKAGFLYGGNDPRLLNRNLNHFEVQQAPDSSYLKIMLDIAPLQNGKPALVQVFRRGYTADERQEKLVQSFAVPLHLIHAQNGHQSHRFHVSSVLGQTEIYIDGQQETNLLGKVNLNPLGQGGDFIAYPVLGQLGIFVPKGNSATFSAISISNYRSPSNVIFADGQQGAMHDMLFAQHAAANLEGRSYSISALDSDVQFLADPSQNAAPMLRTTFGLSNKKIEKARLYVSAWGIYELFLNGERLGDDFFNPGLSQYNKTQYYQTYDVTGMLKIDGKNALGAILSEGWWSGGATYMGEFWNFFGDRQSLLAQLIITYSDGTEEKIVSNTKNWNYFADGPIRYGSFFQGEVYDARKEMEQWCTPAYDDAHWTKASEVALRGNISVDPRNRATNMPMVDDYSSWRLTGDVGPSVKQVKEITAVSVDQVRPGVFVYDMGQNFAGVPKIELRDQEAGRKITLRYAEVKYPELPEYSAHNGMIMLENIRAAMAQDTYITKKGAQTISPRFTYHGYRYVELSGISEAIPLDAVKGEVLSSVHRLSAHYETSDQRVNKLWQNITWSTLSNFVSIPTDCPQRNERLGWSGDISVFAKTATYLADLPLFLRRHMQAMRDVQDPNGRFSDVAPLGGGFGGVLWGSAGITVPWESYQHYGDRRILEEHYAAMAQYIEYLERQIDRQTGVLADSERGNWGSLGDWLSPEYDKTEKSLLWEAYFLYDLEIMQKVAKLLDKPAEADRFAQLYNRRKRFFNENYLDRETGRTVFRGKSVDTQTSYLLPLTFGLIDEPLQEKVLTKLTATVLGTHEAGKAERRTPYALMTGFIGTAWMNPTLSQYGRSDLAYNMLLHDKYPSWLYPVTQGATTIWERLNSYTHLDGFGGNNRMNSFNHYSFGAVGAWMLEHSLGIRRDPDQPAFKHFILAPEVDPSGRIRFAKGHVDTPYGRIESEWKMRQGSVCYTVSIPANTSATISVDAAGKSSVKIDGKDMESCIYARYVGRDGMKEVFQLRAGRYEIIVGGL